MTNPFGASRWRQARRGAEALRPFWDVAPNRRSPPRSDADGPFGFFQVFPVFFFSRGGVEKIKLKGTTRGFGKTDLLLANHFFGRFFFLFFALFLFLCLVLVVFLVFLLWFFALELWDETSLRHEPFVKRNSTPRSHGVLLGGRRRGAGGTALWDQEVECSGLVGLGYRGLAEKSGLRVWGKRFGAVSTRWCVFLGRQLGAATWAFFMAQISVSKT